MPPRSLQPQLHHNVRILLVGDPGVGKTSIILSLISEEFIDGDEGQIPSRSEEIIIPPDVTPELVPTIIVDYSCKEQSEAELVDEILRAHVICIIYGVDNDGSMESIGNYWLPLIRSTLGGGGEQFMEAAGGGVTVVAQQGFKTKIPILLVGNRIDLVDYTTMDIVVPLMNEWPEIETCIECSAKTLRNISELFFYAQKAVLHPTAPLYNSEKKELTEPARQALQRIFRICDVNNDGTLDDLEMYSFQKFCYDSPLQPDALDSVKHIIQRNAIDGVFNNGITLNGFLTLHTLFIQRGKHETTWTALRKFGYNDQITICNDYLCPILSIPITSTAELNQNGLDFFTKIFIKYDRDRDRCLSPEELLNLFSTSPGIPWPPSSFSGVCRNSRGYLTYNGFMCQWVLTTLLDVNKTMEYMAYLGFPITAETDQSEGITVTREKRLDLAKKSSSRNVYRCHVIGARGVGKSTICRQLVQRSGISQDLPNDNNSAAPRYVINSVSVYGQEKYLVMQDIDLARVLDILPTAEIMCDVACLVYDTSDSKSFEFIARTYLNYYSSLKIPVLIIGNKADLGTEVLQDYILQPGQFCTKYNLPQPHLYSSLASGSSSDEIYIKLATMAAFPRFRAAWRIFYRNSHMDMSSDGSVPVYFKALFGIALIGSVGYLIYKSVYPRRLWGQGGGQ